MVHSADVAAWLFDQAVYCTRGTCLPDSFNEKDAEPVYHDSEHERGLVCSNCQDDIFPDTWRITIISGEETPLTCTVEVKRNPQGDKHPVWHGTAYTATIELVDLGGQETVNFWTACIYHPNPARCFYDLREMLDYSSKEYPNPVTLVEDYSTKTVQEAILWTSRWYESVMLRNTLVTLFGSWFKSFENGDYQGEVD